MILKHSTYRYYLLTKHRSNSIMDYPKIRWVKSIKRNGGKEWAYYDNDDDEFILNFSDKHAKRIMSVEPG